MKVYVVTSGFYSDYHIDAIFTNEDMANMYANLDSDRNVEEYETDIESIEADPNKLIYSVDYNFETLTIESLCLTSGYNKEEDHVNDSTLCDFMFYVGPTETLNHSIRLYGRSSDWLMKIAQDRFYMYCDAHNTSRHELLEKRKERHQAFLKHYQIYKTSIDTSGPNMHDPPFNVYWYADGRMTDHMKKYFEEHGKYPDIYTLQKMYDEQVQEVKADHELRGEE